MEMARATDSLAHLPDDAGADNTARCIDVHLSKRKRPRAVTIERAPRTAHAAAPDPFDGPPVRESAMEQLQRTRAAAETAWRLMGAQTDRAEPPTSHRESFNEPFNQPFNPWGDDLASAPPVPRRAEALSRQIRDAADQERRLVVEARVGQRWQVHLCTGLENADDAVAAVHALRDSGEADEVCMSLETVQDGGRTTRLEMLRMAGTAAGAAITAADPQPQPQPQTEPQARTRPDPLPAAPQPAPQPTAASADDLDTDAILSNWLDRVDGRRKRSILDDEDEDDPDPRALVASFNAGLARQALKQALLVGVAAAVILGGLLLVLNGAWAPDAFSTGVYGPTGAQTGVLSPN
jgi:hypothetical protein